VGASNGFERKGCEGSQGSQRGREDGGFWGGVEESGFGYEFRVASLELRVKARQLRVSPSRHPVRVEDGEPGVLADDDEVDCHSCADYG